MKKVIAAGVILLFLCMITMSTFNFTIVKAQTITKDSVTFTHYPPNGLYWSGYFIGCRLFIRNYSVPLFLRDFGGSVDAVGCDVFGDNISWVEGWVGNKLMATCTTPPYGWGITPGPHMHMFGHSPTYTTKVFMNDGQILSDNLTIYRLF